MAREVSQWQISLSSSVLWCPAPSQAGSVHRGEHAGGSVAHVQFSRVRVALAEGPALSSCAVAAVLGARPGWGGRGGRLQTSMCYSRPCSTGRIWEERSEQSRQQLRGPRGYRVGCAADQRRPGVQSLESRRSINTSKDAGHGRVMVTGAPGRGNSRLAASWARLGLLPHRRRAAKPLECSVPLSFEGARLPGDAVWDAGVIFTVGTRGSND